MRLGSQLACLASETGSIPVRGAAPGTGANFTVPPRKQQGCHSAARMLASKTSHVGSSPTAPASCCVRGKHRGLTEVCSRLLHEHRFDSGHSNLRATSWAHRTHERCELVRVQWARPIARSSNTGRTLVSEARNGGSNPPRAANTYRSLGSHLAAG